MYSTILLQCTTRRIVIQKKWSTPEKMVYSKYQHLLLPSVLVLAQGTSTLPLVSQEQYKKLMIHQINTKYIFGKIHIMKSSLVLQTMSWGTFCRFPEYVAIFTVSLISVCL